MRKIFLILLLIILPIKVIANDDFYSGTLDRFDYDNSSLPIYDPTAPVESPFNRTMVLSAGSGDNTTFTTFSPIVSTSPIDACNVALKDGVFNIIITTDHSSTSNTNKSFYCSKDFEDYVNNNRSGVDFGVTIEGVPLKFGSTSDNTNTLKTLRQLCGGTYSNVTTEDFKTYASKQADHAILDAWVKCIELMSTPNLVQFNSTLNGNIITVQAKFRGVTGLAAPTVDELISIGSVECKPTRLVRGAQITLEGLTDYCMRTSPGEGVIILRTNLGDYTIQIARDHSGEIVGNYKIKTNYTVTNEVNLGRITKTFENRHVGFCDNSGCNPVPFEDIIDIDAPFYWKNGKLDSCTRYPGIPCDFNTSGGHHFELGFSMGNHRLRAYGVNGSLVAWYKITYSAEKWRTDTSSQTKYTDPVNIKVGEEFTITMPSNSSVILVVNNQQTEIDPASFQSGNGIKKVRQNGNSYTFINN